MKLKTENQQRKSMKPKAVSQTHRHREQTYGCQVQGGRGRDGPGVWDQQMQTIIQRMDKQQGPPAQHKELCSIPCGKQKWKRT